MADATAFDMDTAPMRIGRVALKVRDLDTVSAFYQAALGLRPMEGGASRVTLGTGTVPLLELAGDPGLAPGDPRQAGLFHTAFLMPSRADLGRWLAHAAAARLPLAGAADHIVSEAIYLADPEGNGIEVYADHPVPRWRDAGGAIRMTTDPLDLADLLAAAGGARWGGFPEAGRIGHVHLQVGDTGAADRFYRDLLGFEVTARYPGASFYGSGGYHHQLAGNVWQSRGAGLRREGMAGLDRVELILRDATGLAAIAARAGAAGIDIAAGPEATLLRDPWGTALALAA